MESTSFNFFGFLLNEPVSALTDYFIALLCLYIYALLLTHKQPSRSIRFWSLFFLFMGVSTFLGGTIHGFRSYLSDSLFMNLWLVMQGVICLSVCFAELGTIESELGGLRLYKTIALIKLLIFLILVIVIKNFKVASIATACGLIPAMIIYYKNGKEHQDKRLISLGVFISFLTLFVFHYKWSIHKWFNYKDISHIIIMISLWVMYVGVREIRPRQLAETQY